LTGQNTTRRPRPVTVGPVTRILTVEEPAVRLFLFHHGGGSHTLYRGWTARFPADWEICLLDFPGRGQQAALPLVGDCGELVGFFHDALRPWLDRPFAFFGHSMGSLVAHELTRRLVREGGPLPAALHVSAYGAPGDGPPPESAEPRHLLDDGQLRDWLRKVGGCPPQLLDNDLFWGKVAPVFRSDLKVVDTWHPPAGRPPLPVPLSASGATDDVLAGPAALEGWRAHTENFLGLHLYDGGHFYLAEHRDAVAETLVAHTRNLLPRPA
jgi:surfactin synthase thioesterase subunit